MRDVTVCALEVRGLALEYVHWMLRRSLAFLVVAALSVGLGGAAWAQDATLIPTATGAIQGTVYLAIEDQPPVRAPIVVFPTSVEQPIPLEDFGIPLDLDDLPATREGAGPVRPDERGEYSVTALAAGEYFILPVTPSATFEIPATAEVVIAIAGETLAVPAFRVEVRAGETTTQDIIIAGPPVPTGPASITICITSFDRQTLDTVQDTVISVEIDPPVEDATITFTEEGCVLIENLPAGTYTFSTVTELGFHHSFEQVLTPGIHVDSGGAFAPPLVGGNDATAEADPTSGPAELPAAGSGDRGGWSLLPMVLGFAVFAAGAIGFGLLRRRGA